MIVDTLIARQPILDASLRVRAYELLFRSGGLEGPPPDPDAATAGVLAGVFADVDRVDPLRGLPGYVNMTRSLLLEGAVKAFPARRVGIEVLEGIEADSAVVAAIDDLRRSGYSVALDDFTLDSGRDELLAHADVVKIDVQDVTGPDLYRTLNTVKAAGATPLAEKVETEDEFKMLAGLGFELFQGFFFARPRLVVGRRLDAGKSRLMALLAEIQNANESIEAVATAVEAQPSVAYQLLRVLGSASTGLMRPVRSIREAVVLLGTRKVVELASVLALAAYGDRPSEVVSMSLTRARFCELLAAEVGENSAASFTVGAFSLLDVFTDLPLWEAVSRLPLDDVILSAIIERDGVLGELLDVAVAYERAAWEQVAEVGLAAAKVSEFYLAALDWSGSMIGVGAA